MDVVDDVEIRDVWASNLEHEIIEIRDIIDEFPFVAMDTEFPGIVANNARTYNDPIEANYQKLRTNVDILHLIQLGLAFFNKSGKFPISPSSGRPVVWQFNFREFDMQCNPFVQASIDLLRIAGINFNRNREQGVDARLFGELFMSSGVVLEESVRWVVFQGSYDFGYLLKILTCRPLPDTKEGFFQLLRVFFPVLYDIKRMIHLNSALYGGLDRVAHALGVRRVGARHQAGSDSFVTARVFLRMAREPSVVSMERHVGVLFGFDDATTRRDYL